MIQKNKNFMSKLLIGCLFLFLIHLNCFGYFLFNGSGGGYPPDEEQSGSTIESYVTTGAGYYLNAHSDIQEFLALIEMQDTNGIDFNAWQRVIDSAIDHMTGAVQTYDLLIATAESTPYNEAFTAKLIEFDYSSFAKENGLNPVIFKRCDAFLKRGDITGMYRYTRAVFASIINILLSVKADLLTNNVPELSTLWRLNETCAELTLFGNYASRVFYAIK